MSSIPGLNLFQWAYQNATFNSTSQNTFPSIAPDKKENICVAYESKGSVPGGSLPSGIVVFKINTFGQLVWIKQDISVGVGYQPSVAIDKDLNVHVVYYTDHVASGQTASGGYDIVVVKMDSNANTFWVRQNPSFNTSANDEVVMSGTAIAISSGNAIFVTYSTQGTTSGQTFVGIDSNVVVFKLDINGDLQWIRQNPSFVASNCNHSSITIDYTDHVCLTYATWHPVSGGLPINTAKEIVVAKLDANGNTIWAVQNPSFNATSDSDWPKIVTDSHANIYVTYTTQGGNITGLPPPPSVGSDIIVFKLSPLGDTLWIIRLPHQTSTEQMDSSIAIDLEDYLYVTYEEAVNHLIYVTKIDSESNIIWTYTDSHYNPTTGTATYPCLTIDADQHICVAYMTNGHIPNQTNTGGDDVVVFKLISYVYGLSPVITSDSSNYLYFTYYSNSSISGQPNLGGHDLYDIVVVKKDSTTGQTLWTLQNAIFNSIDGQINPVIVTYQEVGYVVYQTAGTISGASISFPDDLVILKFDLTNGQIIWVQQQTTFNTKRSDESPSIDVDADGNLYVAFQTTGVVNGGYKTSIPSETLSLTIVNENNILTNNYDIAIFKINPAGQVQWIRQARDFNTPQNNYNPHLVCDRTSQVIYVSFTSNGRILGQNFSGVSDIVLLKMDLNGQIMTRLDNTPWILQQPSFNTTLADGNSTLAVDYLGYLYLAYQTLGTASGQINYGLSDIVIFRLNANGDVVNLTQSNVFNTPFNDVYPSITYRNGHLYVAYQTDGTASGQTLSGRTSIVVMKLNVLTFDVVWIQQNELFDINTDNTLPSLITDSLENCYIVYETTTHGIKTFPIVCQLRGGGLFGWLTE